MTELQHIQRLPDVENGVSLSAARQLFPELEEWLEEVLSGVGMPRRSVMQMLIASDEIFTNICSYAYPNQECPGLVQVSWRLKPEEQSVEVRFCDSGVAFNPLQHLSEEHPTVPHREGNGIRLVQKYTDALDYTREGNQNILTLTKRLS